MKLRLLFTTLMVAAFFATFTSCDEKGDDPVNETATEFKDNGDGTITITDKGEGVGNFTFTSDKVWILNGLVFVNDGHELTIQAGTTIKGKPGTEENASALIVARGGKINAVGTADNPIIFTAEADDGTMDETIKGQWGGVIILGKAKTNNSTQEKAIEGIPTSETRGLYGGTDNSDNSGTLKYVSIRHGGTDIGEGNEINGLTLGAVGSGTTIEYVEVIANKDDGIEFFGGCPEVKHAVVAFCGDDSFDYDEGFDGKGQFWLTVQDADSDRMGEHDGGPSDNELGEPYATPEIYNATYIGNGNEKVITFRDNAGGVYANSIFANQAKGIDIEFLATDDDSQTGETAADMKGCSFKMWEDDLLEVKNNVFENIASGSTAAADIFTVSTPKNDNDEKLYVAPSADVDAWVAYFATANNTAVATATVSGTNPVPSTAYTTDLAAEPSDGFFDDVSYKGAFGSTNWAAGWTLLYKDAK